MLEKLLFPYNGTWKNINLNQVYLENYQPGAAGWAKQPYFCGKMVQKEAERLGVNATFGGYLEDRKDVWKDSYLDSGKTVHLGIDYNVNAGTPVKLPFDGKLICLEHDEDQDGGWGGRAIYKYKDLYVIFAHLGELYGHVGDNCEIGTVIGTVGNSDRNGGWFPHLHVQCMIKYDLSVDGYARKSDYLVVAFPDPEKVICGQGGGNE